MAMERGDIRVASSHADVDASGQERRRAMRKSVLLRATIYPVDLISEVRIRDVSATGARGEAPVELSVGQIVHLTADDLAYHPAIVRWSQGLGFGLELSNAVEIFTGVNQDVDHGNAEGHSPRAVRVQLDCTARLLTSRPPRPAMVRNVSDTGMLIDSGPGLAEGQQLLVRVGNCPPVFGRTQWYHDGKIGIRTTSPAAFVRAT